MISTRMLVMAAAALLGTLSVASCSSETSNADDGSGSPEPRPVEPDQYIDDMCTAASRMYVAYQASFRENLPTLTGMDPTDAYAKTAQKPFAVLIADMEGIRPPADASGPHAETIRQANDVLDALKRGDRQKLLALRGTPDTGKWKEVIDLHPELKSRFGEASQKVDSCQELERNGGSNPFQ